MKVGVFDSGVGGLSVTNAIKKALPGIEVLYREDREHVPYGTRQPSEILQLIIPIFEELITEGCDAIVIACNTVSTTLITDIRQRFDIPFVTVEPQIKMAAALTQSDIIAVCATPATLASRRYKLLKRVYAENIQVLEPDCSDWAIMIQQRKVDRQHIDRRIQAVLQAGADVIVLGCTHYHWIEQEIRRMVKGKAAVIQPERLVIEQLQEVIAQLR